MQDRLKMGIWVLVALVAATMLGLALTVVKAKAADKGGPSIESIFADAPIAPPKSGFSVYLGAHGGVTIANTEISDSGGFFSFDGIGSKGVIGGAHGGVDYIFASRIFIGAYGSYSWQNTETKLTIGSNSASVGLGDSYAAGGRVGYDWGKARVYGLLGYRHTDVDWPTGATGLPSSLTGLDAGLGAGLMLNKNLELGLEGVWTKYKDEDIGSGAHHPVLSTDQLSVLTRLSIKF